MPKLFTHNKKKEDHDHEEETSKAKEEAGEETPHVQEEVAEDTTQDTAEGDTETDTQASENEQADADRVSVLEERVEKLTNDLQAQTRVLEETKKALEEKQEEVASLTLTGQKEAACEAAGIPKSFAKWLPDGKEEREQALAEVVALAHNDSHETPQGDRVPAPKSKGGEETEKNHERTQMAEEFFARLQ